MRTLLFLSLLLTRFTMSTQVQSDAVVDRQLHRVIMQVTQADSAFQLTVIGQLKNIKKALPEAKIEVVCHSQGLPMLLKDETKVAQHVRELSEQNVTFAACENTLRRRKATEADLLPSATTVPSGLVEIILKQEQGWAYVKGGI